MRGDSGCGVTDGQRANDGVTDGRCVKERGWWCHGWVTSEWERTVAVVSRMGNMQMRADGGCGAMQTREDGWM